MLAPHSMEYGILSPTIPDSYTLMKIIDEIA